MFIARAGFGAFSKNPFNMANRHIVWLAVATIMLCLVASGQSLNIKSTEFPIPSGASPLRIATGPDGAVWFTEPDVKRVGRITTSGTITEYSVQTLLIPGAPFSIATGPDAALWFTNGFEIGRITPSGTVTFFPVQNSSFAIAAGSDGAMWFSEGSWAIGRISMTGVISEYNLPGYPGPGGGNVEITLGPDGAIWFLDYWNKAIGRITTAGAITEYPVPNVGSQSIATGPDGALWFGMSSSQIGRITTSGVVTTFPVTSPNSGNTVITGITGGPDGSVWFCDNYPEIGRITTDGTVTFYSTPTYGLDGITLGPDGALWYPADQPNHHSIVRVQIPHRAGVLSHIAAGGGWTTVITLVNASSTAVPVTLALHNEDGSALTLPLTTTQQGVSKTINSSLVNATMNPNTTLLISTGDQVASTVVGWADVTSVGQLGGYAIFRQNPQAGSPSEGTVPLQSQFPPTVTLPYDNTAGFVMGVALANLSTSSANITATMWDDGGNQLGTQIITIAGSGHTSFVLPTQLALTAGRRGIVQFQSAPTGGISGIGLRFSPFGTFTSVPTM